MATDKEVILSTLQRERDELHDKIMQVDRIIKKIKTLNYEAADSMDEAIRIEGRASNKVIAPVKALDDTTDIKVHVLSIIEHIGKAVRLKDIQAEYFRISGKSYNVREAVRSLNRQRIILMLRQKDAVRGVVWVKKDWLRNGVLLDEHKPEGFDLFYAASNLIYE